MSIINLYHISQNTNFANCKINAKRFCETCPICYYFPRMKNRIVLTITALFYAAVSAAFTVVIDAGHGGHDAGAIGSYSKEKNINLKYALLVGNMLKEKNPDIKVIFTRDKDVFVELKERAAIANRANADLFVSIHTNSSKSQSANGMETFTLGASRSKENMEVAMLENSVILLEEDHESKYEGFDPNSTDSYIMFEFMKDQYSNFSIQCADLVQKNIIEASGRTDRGVRQAGFLVLRATAMPSILIELGFISNRAEEKFLNQSANQVKVATAIYNAIVDYKHELEKKNGGVQTGDSATAKATAAPATAGTAAQNSGKTENAVPAKTSQSGILLYVQFLASGNKYAEGDSHFKGLKGIVAKQEGKLYKYMTGGTDNIAEIEKIKNQVQEKFPEAFIVAYENGKKTDAKAAMEKLRK